MDRFNHLLLEEWYWIAGLLEAEGSFMKGSPSAPKSPICKIEMTDKDVIEHLSSLLDSKMMVIIPKVSYHKAVYRVMLRGRKAVLIMNKVFPVMILRRQKQITNALLNYDETYSGKYLSLEEKLIIHKMFYEGCTRKHICATLSRSRETIKRVLEEQYFLSHSLETWNKISYTNKIFWLAGWIEGEGSFPNSKNNQKSVSGTSVDKDMIERISKFLEAKYYITKHPNKIWNDTYTFYLSASKTYKLILLIYPILFQRRKNQIKVLFETSKLKLTSNNKLNETHIVEIKKMRESNVVLREIAQKFNVSIPKIHYVLKEKFHSKNHLEIQKTKVRDTSNFITRFERLLLV